jgi:predicted phosphoadenosine phosphosulfate sulfurtransferase
MSIKLYKKHSVLDAARKRIQYAFNNFEKYYVSFSGGKDSSVMFHLVMEEAIKRNVVVGVLLIDFEAQYKATSDHAMEMFERYADNIDVHWVCLPMALRNAVSNFEPKWICWDEDEKDMWVREFPDHPSVIKDVNFYPFFQKGMEFEEFIVLFGEWYGDGDLTAAFIGIRCDESLNRFRTIATARKDMFDRKQFTTKVIEETYNVYPIYDWRTEDIWVYHGMFPENQHNKIYDLMNMAGVKLSQQRLCQPYGDDQRRGLFLYHILEPETWRKIVARVNGVNSGSLYIQESGNINGNRYITKPDNHTYKSYCELLLSTLPIPTQKHYTTKFKVFLKWWYKRGYDKGIPDEAPRLLESQYLAPSWRRICKTLLRNDYWCKGLRMSQPKSEAYGKYLDIKKSRKSIVKPFRARA